MALTALQRNAIKQMVAVGIAEAQAVVLVTRGGGGGAPRIHGETVVPDDSGTGIRPAGPQGALFAAVGASAVIQYDQGALAAIWSGLFDALRTGGAVDVDALFPDPCSLGPLPDRAHAQERAIGQQMASMIGLAIKGLDVTTQEWAAWYARSAAVNIRRNDCAPRGAPQLPAAGGTVGGWGSPFGPPAFGGGASGGGGAGGGY